MGAMATTAPCSRIAPSPTGPLHLGNACTFLVNWALARRLGWRLVLRIEDLDADRTAAGADADVAGILAWIGIRCDGEPVRQRVRLARYEDAMSRLAAAGLVYESPHSRAEVREAAAARSAPHAGDAPRAFPRALRPSDPAAWRFARRDVNHRFRVDDGAEQVHDQVCGDRAFDCAATEGDFIVWTKAGWPAYQLAVTVDDIAQGVTDVVRGDDLLPSAALQARIHRALGAAPPRWWHLPLVADAGGQRMAKRRGSASLASLREAGVDPARVAGLVAWWVGALPAPEPVDPARFPAMVDEPILRHWHTRAAGSPPTLDERSLAWLHAR
jgi:glutamyl-tRNA synthetase